MPPGNPSQVRGGHKIATSTLPKSNNYFLKKIFNLFKKIEIIILKKKKKKKNLSFVPCCTLR
jgi:hypothetical protein